MSPIDAIAILKAADWKPGASTHQHPQRRQIKEALHDLRRHQFTAADIERALGGHDALAQAEATAKALTQRLAEAEAEIARLKAVKSGPTSLAADSTSSSPAADSTSTSTSSSLAADSTSSSPAADSTSSSPATAPKPKRNRKAASAK